ncbi:MAG TPA: hypothetical protein VG407_00100 [Caulobacteraceae bacterium]|nr:hypothetical protein [Caulobacteraceae bacterium]
MASPIRPLPPSFIPPVRQSDHALAAQRAFFQAALSGTASAAPAAAVQTPKAVQPTPRVQQADASESPRGWARPGSRLDIKV